MKALRLLPPISPGSVALAERYHAVRLVFAPLGPRRRTGGRGSLGSATRHADFRVETTGVPKFLGNPDCPGAMFLDSGRTARP